MRIDQNQRIDSDMLSYQDFPAGIKNKNSDEPSIDTNDKFVKSSSSNNEGMADGRLDDVLTPVVGTFFSLLG